MPGPSPSGGRFPGTRRGEATGKGAATAGLICGTVATVVPPLLGILLVADVMGGTGTAS